jgi:hypothetical protein
VNIPLLDTETKTETLSTVVVQYMSYRLHLHGGDNRKLNGRNYSDFRNHGPPLEQITTNV